MALRDVGTILGSVYRKTFGRYETQRIFEAFDRVHREVYQNYHWPWQQAFANIAVFPIYNTGTITIADGSDTATGTNTVWDILWTNKVLNIGSNTVYPVSEFTAIDQLTLAAGINTGQDWNSVPYTIYQDTYPLPSDCEPGNIVLIVNPLIRYRLLKRAPYTVESNAVSRGVVFNNLQQTWCDAGYDDVAKNYLIRFDPPPGTTTEYRIGYYRTMPYPSKLTDTSAIPPTFDALLEYLTIAELKKDAKDQTWVEDSRKGNRILQGLRQQVATNIDDQFADYMAWGFGTGSSIVDPSGLVIAGPVQP